MSAAITEFAAQVEALRAIAEGEIPGECFSNDEILSLGLAEFPGPVSNEWLRREAAERLGEVLEAA
jgi:hypothetical protein